MAAVGEERQERVTITFDLTVDEASLLFTVLNKARDAHYNDARCWGEVKGALTFSRLVDRIRDAFIHGVTDSDVPNAVLRCRAAREVR